jgi:hypothetical protein
VIDTVIMGNPVSVPVDSVRIKHSAVKSSVFDGWGTLTLPNGQVDALRQQTYERSQDSAWVHINYPGFYTGWVFYTSFEDTINQYVWWSEFSGMPLLKMNYDSLSLQISMVDWLYDPELFIGREDDNPEIGIFPNPANDMLTIRTDVSFDMLQVFDRNGREVYRKGIEGKNDIIVHTAGLVEGFYLVRLSGNTMPPVIKKIIIQR